MKLWQAAAAACALAVTATPCPAQEAMETVVVTGARAQSFDPATVPHLYLLRRADHVITKVRVVCDTRELSKRRQELKDTLRNMIREAKASSTISLGVGEEIVEDLTDTMLDKVILPDGGRADTSMAWVVIKTRVSKDDRFDDATTRIQRFIEATPKAGRTEILRENRWDLTIVGPEQYRPTLIAKIAADSKETAGQFGPDYIVKVQGLEHPISWYQKGPLDLALYIPYSLVVAPQEP